MYAVLLLAITSLTGCSVLEGLAPAAGSPQETSVALTVSAFTLPTVIPPTSLPIEPPTPEPTYTFLPTYTDAPTYTPLPTYTSPPTYTPLPSFTPQLYYFPTPVYQPTPLQISEHPYVLRVRNQNFKTTLWIGTVLPYGGNFIKPLHYVEFYPPRPTWMRIWWCRRSWLPKDWDDKYWDYDDWEKYWNDKDKYFCQHKDVYVDEAFQQFGVK